MREKSQPTLLAPLSNNTLRKLRMLFYHDRRYAIRQELALVHPLKPPFQYSVPTHGSNVL